MISDLELPENLLENSEKAITVTLHEKFIAKNLMPDFLNITLEKHEDFCIHLLSVSVQNSNMLLSARKNDRQNFQFQLKIQSTIQSND